VRRTLLRWLLVTVITAAVLLAHLLTDHDTGPGHALTPTAPVAIANDAASVTVDAPTASPSLAPGPEPVARAVMSSAPGDPLVPDWHVVAVACILALALVTGLTIAHHPARRHQWSSGVMSRWSGPLPSWHQPSVADVRSVGTLRV
jgi:hypothetical protein